MGSAILSGGLLALALLAFVFYSARPTRWVVSVGVLTLAATMTFFHLGLGSFYDWDEAWYAQVSREILASNEWGALHYNGFPFLHKPPLYFWLTALTYKFVGINEFGARFWSAAFGFGLMVLTFFLGVRLRSWTVGASAVLILLVTSYDDYSHTFNFFSLVRVGMLETSLTFWVMTAVMLVWESDRRPWLIALIGLPFGLAVMTKAWSGAYALLIPLVYVFFAKRTLAPVGYWFIAFVLASIVILPWHLWQLWIHGYGFIHDYVVVNLIIRATEIVEQKPLGAFYYLSVLHSGLSVWAYALPAAYAWALWKAFKDGDRRAYLLLSWITIPLLLFSLSQTKLGWYISLIYPATALLLAVAMAELLSDRVALAGIAAVMAVCCIRSPLITDGQPGVKVIAKKVEPYLDSKETVFLFDKHCAGKNIPPTWIFYLNVPLGCIDQMGIREGVRGQFIIGKEFWATVSDVSNVVYDAGSYLLARSNISLQPDGRFRGPTPYVTCVRNTKQDCNPLR